MKINTENEIKNNPNKVHANNNNNINQNNNFNMNSSITLLNSQHLSQTSPKSLLKSVRFNKGRPSTQGGEPNFLAISSRNSLELSSGKKVNQSLRGSLFKSNNNNNNDFFPVRMSIFGENKRESIFFLEKNSSFSPKKMNENKKTEDLPRTKTEESEFLHRFKLLAEKEKTIKNVESENFKEKIKKRIKTAYIINSRNEIEKIEKDKEINKSQKRKIKLKKNGNHPKSKEKNFSMEFKSENKFKSKLLENNWTQPSLKEYQNKLRAGIKTIRKELSLIK